MIANFFWKGILTDYQLASMLSFKKNGFDVILWSDEFKDVEKYGIKFKNSEDILSFSSMGELTQVSHHDKNRAGFYEQVASYSDIFRIKLLQEQDGIWSDCDVFCLKPVEEWQKLYDLTEDILASTHIANGEEIANTGLLGFKNKETVTELYNRLQKIMQQKDKHRWGDFGPWLLDGYIKDNNITNLCPTNYFYPVHFTEWQKVYSTKKEDIEYCLTQTKDSYALHWWNDAFEFNGVKKMPPADSYLGQLFSTIPQINPTVPKTNIDYTIVKINDRAKYNVEQTKRMINGNYHELKFVDANKVDVYDFFKQRDIQVNWMSSEQYSMGELGVIASNILIMEYIVKNDIKEMLVFEDDEELDKDFINSFFEYRQEVPDNFDVFSLNVKDSENWLKFTVGNNFEIGSDKITKAYLLMNSLTGIVYTKAGAEKLLTYYKKFGVLGPGDFFLFTLIRHKLLNGYNVKTELLNHRRSFQSTIDGLGGQRYGRDDWMERQVKLEEYIRDNNNNVDKGFVFSQQSMNVLKNKETITKKTSLLKSHKERLKR